MSATAATRKAQIRSSFENRSNSLAEQIFDYRISSQIDDKVIKIANWNLFLLAIYYCIIAKKLMQFLKHIFQLLY